MIVYEFVFSTKEKARDSCNVLFLEIVSKIIFAAASSPTMNEPPEDELVSELIETVISTQELSPFSDKKADKTPLVRSHLLQLLLDYEYAVLVIYVYIIYIIKYGST